MSHVNTQNAKIMYLCVSITGLNAFLCFCFWCKAVKSYLVFLDGMWECFGLSEWVSLSQYPVLSPNPFMTVLSLSNHSSEVRVLSSLASVNVLREPAETLPVALFLQDTAHEDFQRTHVQLLQWHGSLKTDDAKLSYNTEYYSINLHSHLNVV